MKIVLWLAKLIVLGFWVGAVYFTFIHPLPGKISTLIPAFAVLMLLVHGIQAALLTLIAKDLLPLTVKHYISVLLFGFFTMLELREQLFKAAQAQSSALQARKKDQP
jgi:putative membrane protein